MYASSVVGQARGCQIGCQNYFEKDDHHEHTLFVYIWQPLVEPVRASDETIFPEEIQHNFSRAENKGPSVQIPHAPPSSPKVSGHPGELLVALTCRPNFSECLGELKRSASSIAHVDQ